MTVGITELPPEGMQLPGVSLAGDPERGTKTTEGISLLFTAAGVTVQGPQPQIERLLVWKALDSASCREKIQLPDGREAVIMELTSGGQSIRFLLPDNAVSPGQAAYLDQALPAWLLRYKGAVPAPVAPGATASTEPEVGVTLPPPGPNAAPAAAAEAAPAPAAEAAPAFANAGAVVAGAGGASALTQDPADGIAPGIAAGGAPPTSGAPSFQAPPMAAPPAPANPAGPTMYATPPNPGAPQAPTAPGFQTLPPPPPPSAPTFQAPPPPPPAAPAPPVARPGGAAAAPVGGWAEPPAGSTGAEDAAAPKPAKKPRFALTRKQLHAAEAAAAAGGAAVAPTSPSPSAPEASPATPQTTIEPPKPAKKPRFALTRKQLHAAEAAAAAGGAAAVAPDSATLLAPSAPEAPPAVTPQTSIDPPKPAKKPRFALTRKQLHAAEAAAAAGGAVAAGSVAHPAAPPADLLAPPTGLTGTAPVAAPVDPVPLTVQPLPPPPAPGATTATPPGADGTVGAPSGTAGSVSLAKSGSSSRRTVLVGLVVLLVIVLAGAGYLITRKSSPTSTATPPATAPSGAADTVLAGLVNLRQSDLPSGWTETAPAQAVVRPPVAPAAAQATATNALAGCLGSNVAVVSGLFASGSLPGQTSLVQSPVFQSAAGSSFEMASRTTVLSSAGEVQALNSVFSNPRFDGCYQQFRSSLASAVAPGATVAVEPVTLSAPSGVTTYGVVSTYTLPGSGTQVVGDAYILGGRVVTILQPTTSGADIPSSVFGPAYNSVAGRVAASASK